MDYQRWLWAGVAAKCVKNLKKHGFDAHFSDDTTRAFALIMEMVEPFATFGFAGSDTTRQLGLPEALRAKGKTVFDHWDPALSREENLACRRAQLTSDCFLCSANAISLTGEIVNVDGIGNRTSAMGFGPTQVVIVAGMNKVVKNLEAAQNRVFEVAAPMRAKSLGMETPCAKNGLCSDCNDPMRICCITTILHRKPMLTDISVVLIGERLGF
jgi:L-lactate utilization protein LutB